uniref:Zona pellucida sperm-binding protein 3 n=1 Tax=Clupea pallasii TaxID=30724 RepID=K4PZ87_CLUPA|nr:egg envelope protein [Clupea pallasii]
MGFRAWFSVVLVLFGIGLQIQAKTLPDWFKREEQDRAGLSDWSAHSLLEEDPPEESVGESSLPEPQSTVQEPVRKALKKRAQEPVSLQSKQTLQGPVKQLSWRFPRMPEKPKEPERPLVLRELVPANSVAVRCREADVQVEVNRDFFGTGQLIHPADLSLGDCAVTGEDPSDQVLVFEYELHRCDGKIQVTPDELVYSFTLQYAPKALNGSPIIKTNGATVDIQCHYPREHNVSSDALMPTWVPFAATKAAEEVLVFSLRLMTDDWEFERAINTYYLGSVLHIEASVIQYNHVPLRVFAHSCVATAVPDVNASPRYSFIENHGCLVDAKLTGSGSRFLPRVQDNRLQFELEAFRFAQAEGTTIYITCKLVATAASTDSDHKSCSFSDDRWTSADGNDQMCRCCDSTCGPTRKTRDVSADEQWVSEAVLGPMLIKDAY